MIGRDTTFSLGGQVALVTGATGYLGRAMAIALAEAGATVLVNSRSGESVAELASFIKRRGLNAEEAVFDVAKHNCGQRALEVLDGRPLSVLINNAYAGNGGTVETSTQDEYSSAYNITVIAAHRLVQSLLPNLRLAVDAFGGASVINISSMYGLVSPDQRNYRSATSSNPPFYGAAKAALTHWSRYAACEFGRERIRVNTISPGPFPSIDVAEAEPRLIEILKKKVPMGRVGTPEDIVGPVLFLASPASAFVNGADIVVDGGWTCW